MNVLTDICRVLGSSLLIVYTANGFASSCGSINETIGYDAGSNYGGPWATTHRDGRNSDFADCELASRYRNTWALETTLRFPLFKPVVGPGNIAWLTAMPEDVGMGGVYLYGVEVETGHVVAALGEADGVKPTAWYNQPLIARDGQMFFTQEIVRSPDTPCRHQDEGVEMGRLCAELVSFDSSGNYLWRVPVDGVSFGSQWTASGKLLLQSWRGSSYVIDTADGLADSERVLFAGNHFPDAASSLPNYPDVECLAFGLAGCALVHNMPAVHPETGAIYNTFNLPGDSIVGAEDGDSFVQRFIYDAATDEVAVDPEWQTEAGLPGGSATSVAIDFSGEVLFVNDAATGTYAIDAISGELVASVQIGYTPSGSPLVVPNFAPDGDVIGAYIVVNGAFADNSDDESLPYLTILEYRPARIGKPSLKVLHQYDGSGDPTGVAWISRGSPAGGILDKDVVAPETRVLAFAEKACNQCVGNGRTYLLVIDPASGRIESTTKLSDKTGMLAIADDGYVVSAHVGGKPLRGYHSSFRFAR